MRAEHRRERPSRAVVILVAVLVIGFLGIGGVTGIGVRRGRMRLRAQAFAESIVRENQSLQKHVAAMRVELTEFWEGRSEEVRLKAALNDLRIGMDRAFRVVEGLESPGTEEGDAVRKRYLDLFRYEKEEVLPELQRLVARMVSPEPDQELIEESQARLAGPLATEEVRLATAANAAAREFLKSEGVPVP